MKVVIAGGRKFDDFKYLKTYCDTMLGRQNPKAIEIVSGGAGGADALGERYARIMDYKITRFPAPWNDIKDKPKEELRIRKDGSKYWILAGHFRNEQMAKYVGKEGGLIAFWDGRSTGTKNMIQMAEKHKLMVRVAKY